MHKPHTAEISYGTIGQAFYNTDLSQWEFTRDLNEFQKLRIFGIDGLAVASSRNAAPEGSSTFVQKSQQRKLLSLRYPETIPAIPLLSEIAKEEIDAKYLLDLSALCYGDLISTGRATDFDNRKVKSAYKLFAFPDGKFNTDLRIHLAHTEYYCSARAEKAWLAIPRIQDVDPGWWRGKAGPIQQICFASSTDDQSDLLAIRSSRAISILKPLHRRSPIAQPAPPAKLSSFSESCIDANQLLSVSCDTKPWSVFVDVNFNPWHKRQFAAIDSNGNWTIYEIKGKAGSKRTFRALQMERDKLSKVEPCDWRPASGLEDDQWGKIFWIKDINMILACNRLDLALFDMEEGIISIHHIKVELAASEIILDVQKCIGIDDLVIVLTCSAISLIRVDRMANPEVSTQPGVSKVRSEILHTWRHNRDQSDKTLRLCHTVVNCFVEVILYSRRKSLLSLHTFLLTQDEFSFPLSLYNPTEIEHSAIMFDKAQNSEILTLLLEPVRKEKAKQRLSIRTAVPGSTDNSIRYYILFIFWSDFSITESVYYIQEPEDAFSVEKPLLVGKSLLSQSRIGPLGSAAIDDDYIKNVHCNGLPATSLMKGDRQLLPPMQNLSLRKTVRKALSRTVDFSTVLHKRTVTYESLPNLVQIIRQSFHDNSYLHDCSTLYYHVGEKYKVQDIDEASQVLEDALFNRFQKDEIEEQSSKPSQIVPIYLKPCISDDGVMRLSVLYEYLVAHWLALLPDKVSSKVRLAKEKLARQLAAELCLASIIFRHNEQTTEEGMEQKSSVAGNNISSPLQPTVFQESYLKEGQDPNTLVSDSHQEPRLSPQKLAAAEMTASSYPALPTPSATPSAVSSSSAYTAKSLNCTVLNTYGHVPATRTLPKALSRCLTTWNLGENPHAFDGDMAIETVMRPRDADEDNENGMSASERRRLQRRAERLLKRQRRQAAKAAGLPTPSSNSISLQLRPATALPSSQLTAGIATSATATAATAVAADGGSSQPMRLPLHLSVSSQMPLSSQNVERVHSSGVQTAEGSARKRRRLAGF